MKWSLWLLPIMLITVGVGGAAYRAYTEAGGGMSGLIVIGLIVCGTLVLEYVKRKREKRAPKSSNDFDSLTTNQKRTYEAWLNRLLPLSAFLIGGGLCVLVFLPSQRALWVAMALLGGAVVLVLDRYLHHLSRQNRTEQR